MGWVEGWGGWKDRVGGRMGWVEGWGGWKDRVERKRHWGTNEGGEGSVNARRGHRGRRQKLSEKEWVGMEINEAFVNMPFG